MPDSELPQSLQPDVSPQAVTLPEPPSAPLTAPPWQRLLRNPRSLAALALIVLMIFLALSAPILAPYSYSYQERGSELVSPRAAHWMGTDELGRDVFSRMMYGAQISMVVGILATSISLLIGVNIGLFSGYFGGWVDAFLMRLTDTVAAFPTLLFALAIAAVLQSDVTHSEVYPLLQPQVRILFIALGVVGWTGIARIVRSQVLSVRTLDYVTAARALGAGEMRVIFKHVLPNCVSPIIVVATLAVGGNILGEAGLSFLGLGVQPPFPSWGGMLSDARSHFRDYWWVAVCPGMAIVLTVLSFNLLGDGLRDALDPKSRS